MTGNHLMYSKAARKVMTHYLQDHYTPEQAEALLKATEKQYLLFLQDVPNLGGKKNSQAQSVYDCIGLFAFYEALPEKLSREAFEVLVDELFVPAWEPIRFANMNRKFLQRIASWIFLHLTRVGKAHARDWPGNYHMYAQPYDPKTGVHFGFTSCPIADFARTHGYVHLMPAMCNPDYPTLSQVRATLIRTRTCALDDCCDYWIVGNEDPVLKEHPLYRDEMGFLRNK